MDNEPISYSVAITGQTGRVYDAKLAMTGEPLPFLVDKAVKFLGLPITTRFDSEEIKSSLMSKLDNYLTRSMKHPLPGNRSYASTKKL